MRRDPLPAAPARDQPVPSDAVVRRRLTRFARLPERIALCIDVSPEMGQPWSASSPIPTRLDVLKQALTAFVHIKSLFNPRHEFALVTVDEQVSRVVLPFSVALPEIYRTLNGITPVGTWPPAAPASAAVTDSTGAAPAFNGINLSHLLDSTLPSLLSKYLKRHRDHTYDNPLTSSSSSHPALARAILFMGASYALPLLPQPCVVQSLFANDTFFFDMMYIHARKAFPPLHSPPPPPSSSTTTEVVLLDLADDQDEVAVAQTLAAGQALPPSLPPPPPPPPPRTRRSAEIWNSCLDLLVDQHPLLPESGYCFSVLHGSSTDRVLTPLQLLLAHPAQRLPQSMTEERLDYPHVEPKEKEQGGGGGGGRGGGKGRRKWRRGEVGAWRERRPQQEKVE